MLPMKTALVIPMPCIFEGGVGTAPPRALPLPAELPAANSPGIVVSI